MAEALVELLTEAAGVVVETVLVGVLTTIGLLGEGTGISTLTGGEMLGLWYVYIGTVALYAGYQLFKTRLLPDLREMIRESTAS